MSNFALSGRCHCGAVRWTLHQEPDHLTSCNCSLCRRLGALWAHAEARHITLHHDADAVIAYVQGDRTLATVSCRTCGSTTHWQPTAGPYNADPDARMAVNATMADPEAIRHFRVRHFDGADSWRFVD